MHSKSPMRRLLAFAFVVAFALSPFVSALAQDRSSKQNVPVVGSPDAAILDLGSSVLDTAGRFFDADPYSEFRGVRYTNEGLLSERDEIKLGNELNAEVGKKYQVINEGQQRLNRIGQRTARASLRPSLPYRFHIIRDKEINAFAAPGGHVYVTSALMNLANDDELASVVAHEIGHIVARHSLKTIQQSQALGGIADLIGSVTGIAGDTASQIGRMAASVVGNGLLSIHNREEEREADFLGVHTMTQAGFNPDGMVTMFQKLRRVSQTNIDLLGSLFSDHPDVEERISNTRYEINRMRGSRG